jgi:hypothetical protein
MKPSDFAASEGEGETEAGGATGFVARSFPSRVHIDWFNHV